MNLCITCLTLVLSNDRSLKVLKSILLFITKVWIVFSPWYTLHNLSMYTLNLWCYFQQIWLIDRTTATVYTYGISHCSAVTNCLKNSTEIPNQIISHCDNIKFAINYHSLKISITVRNPLLPHIRMQVSIIKFISHPWKLIFHYNNTNPLLHHFRSCCFLLRYYNIE